MLKFTISNSTPKQAKVDVLAVLLLDAKNDLAKVLKFLPPKTLVAALHLAKQKKFTAKNQQILTLTTHGQLPAFLLMLIGLGTSKQSKEEVMENVRLALASAAQISERHQALRLGVSIPEKLSWFLTAEQIGQSTSEGVTLGAY